MAKELYVGNIPFSMGEEQLRELFSQHGELESVVLKVDKFTQRSRGYGFVTFVNDAEAESAIAALNGHEIEYTFERDGETQTMKRALIVNESRPKVEGDRPPRRDFNGGGDRRGGGGFRSGGGDRRGGGGFRSGGGGGNRRPRYDDNGFEVAA